MTDELWLRTSRATAIDAGEDVILLGRTVRRLEGASAELARVVLAFLARPRRRGELIAHLEAIAGPIEHPEVIAQLLELLAEAGAIGRLLPPAGSAATARAPAANIVVGVSGALAASHAPALVGALQRRGHTVEVALTATAARFVAVDALAVVAQRAVHASMWPHAAFAPIPHVALAEWADLVVIYPASATTLGRIANGDLSDLVSAIALTTRAAVVLVPSMNADMLDAPAIARNLARLRADGHAIVHGVPSVEAADAPAARQLAASAAPPPGEVAAAIDALLAARVLRDRGARGPRWDEAYRALGREAPAWLSAPCDPAIAAALAAHVPPPARVLEVGCGTGIVARHAAALGHRVVATDISEIALQMARAVPGADGVVWVRDDACASALAGPFDAIVDRGVLHVLSRERAIAWGATVARLLAPGGVAIVECHADGVPGATLGWTAAQIATLTGLLVIEERATTLPHPRDGSDVPSRLVVLTPPRGATPPA